MADKEYTVIEIVDVLRRQAAGDKISAIARATGMDRKTVRKYIRIAEGKVLTADSEEKEKDGSILFVLIDIWQSAMQKRNQNNFSL